MRSKLPDVGTTIFSVISRRAGELGAINLGQGFPDYDIDPRLTELVGEAMRAGFNQYAPMPGWEPLRRAIAAQLQQRYASAFDAEREITVTLGATEAIFSAVQALVGSGDEVLVFDPAYDSYDPAVRLAGGHCVHLPLLPPHFRYDWERVAAAITPRTRLLIINTPHNPACTCMTAEDLTALSRLADKHDLYVISDEVYEHLVLDGRSHESALSIPALRRRSVAVYSFGKALHATGLRVGYAIAPPELTTELRKVHQFNTFTIATPLQVAIAAYVAENPGYGLQLGSFFTAKRDRLLARLADTGLGLTPAEGSFFQLIDYSDISDLPDVDFAEQLLTEARVASIPLSVFYQAPPPMSLLRLCFAKRDATLDEAGARLRSFLTHQLRAVSAIQ